RIFSDELWHFYGGAPVQLRVADAQLREVRELRLGPVSEHGAALMHAVPAGYWQAARSSAAANGYSLMGCTVAPGFDCADVRLRAADPAASMPVRAAGPHLADWLEPGCFARSPPCNHELPL
ncbi:MAG: cupin domain-containing protein, partial [Betaproteobacteria bacterium]